MRIFLFTKQNLKGDLFMKENAKLNLEQAVREAKKEYYKRWRAKPENKEKQKLYNQHYWEKKALQNN
jgi:hypothetical protein